MTAVSEPKEIGRFESLINHLRRWNRFLRQWQPGIKFWRAVGVLVLVALLWVGYVWLGRPVTLVINGQPYPIRAHR